MIIKSVLDFQKERLGDFWVSPRGRKKERIAWHFSIDHKEKKIYLYIDDFFYHKERSYIEEWDVKAANRKITLKDYGPYLPYEGL